jgi:hypothetical protein
MILSTQIANKNDDEDSSSSESDIKNACLNELKNIIKKNEVNKKSKISEIGKKSRKNLNNITGEDSSYNISKIEFKNQSISSSMRSLSRGEDFLQKDILQVLNGPNNVSLYIFIIIIYFIIIEKK